MVIVVPMVNVVVSERQQSENLAAYFCCDILMHHNASQMPVNQMATTVELS